MIVSGREKCTKYFHNFVIVSSLHGNVLHNPQGKVQRIRDSRNCLCLVNLQDVYRSCYSE